ncbi:MAG TPA: hypothetical protein VN725_10640 [Rhodanobacteraceae bacterium]|nr:hypothetical protein [Rhodanobacteraceae bacterium]
MESKPEWVPVWIWNEYLSERSFWADSTNDDADDMQYSALIVERFDALIRDRGCQCLWRAMDSRRGKLKENLRSYFDRKGWRPDIPIGGEAERVLSHIAEAAEGIPKHERFSAAERRESGLRIAKLANDLLTALEKIDFIEHGLPRTFNELHQRAAAHIAIELCRVNVERLSSQGVTADALEVIQEWMEVSALASLSDYPTALRAIADGGQEWAATTPPVPRVHSDGAARLYFIREMTSYFREYYNTPLREQVAALTRCIFKCEMDTPTVAKLAP